MAYQLLHDMTPDYLSISILSPYSPLLLDHFTDFFFSLNFIFRERVEKREGEGEIDKELNLGPFGAKIKAPTIAKV